MGEAFGQDSLRRAVVAAGIDAEPLWLDETGSTNTDALRLAEDGAPEWTVVATGHQTAGRGRLGRTWEDEPGRSLLLSIVLRPSFEPELAPLVTLAAARAMIDAAGVPGMRSKWPNDLLVGERKVGGILAEASVEAGRIRHVVLGIGVNLTASGVPDGSATSLAEEGADPDLGRLLAGFLTAFRRAATSAGFPADVARHYEEVCATLGQRVRVRVGADVVEGVATALDDRGSLIVETSDGARTVVFGEVTHVISS